MTLVELCEPLFQYVCRINRAGRIGAACDASQVRGDLKRIFATMESDAPDTPGLLDQYRLVRQPLVFFCDYIIRTSNMPFAMGWSNLAEEENPPIYTGDELFFRRLDETMVDRTEAANARLAVYYTCMGLGFLGLYESDIEQVQRRMREIAGRIRKLMDDDGARRICPEAYECLNTADLTEPPTRSLLPMTIALIALIAILFGANIWLYDSTSRKVTDSVKKLVDKVDTSVQAETAKR